MNPLLRLQLDLADALDSDPRFATITVFSRAKGVIEQDIVNALGGIVAKGGKSGACVIVMMPEVAVPNANASGPRMDITMTVRVLEMPMLNRDNTGGTGINAEEIVLNVLSTLHGRILGGDITQVHAATKGATPVEIEDTSLCYDVFFSCRFGLASPIRVATPVFSGNAASLQISCNTAGATVYYTTDGSFPWSGNPDAILFGYALLTEAGIIITTEEGNPLSPAIPLTVSPGTQVRSVAYKPTTHQASDCASIAPN